MGCLGRGLGRVPHPREMERGVARRCAGEGHGASAGGFEVLVSKNLTLLRSAGPFSASF